MKLENDLIPYQCSPLPQGPWLVFAPHPDDESFGMGGSLLLAAQQGIEVTLIIMTDGSKGGKTEESNKKELISIRQKEVKAAAKKFAAKDVIFLNLPDRALHPTNKLINKIATFIESTKPQSVFFPTPMELHPDHRATAQLVWEGLIKAKSFQGNALAYDISIQGQVNYLIDISNVIGEKSTLMSQYSSQLTENNYISIIESLDKARTYTLSSEVTAAEGFYQYPFIEGDLTSHTIKTLKPYWEESNTPPKKSPLVSIIIRTQNRPGLLKEAITSLAEQDYSNIELIIVNDGGKDIAFIFEPFTALFTDIKHHHFETPMGRSNAANQGLKMAKGALIGFLDDDDWLAPEHLSSLVKQLESNTNGTIIAAYSSTECINTNSKTLIRTYNQSYDHTHLNIENYIPLHSLIFKRHVIDKNYKCAFDPSLDLYEDWDFWLQLSKLGNFTHTNKVTAFYRIIPGSGEGVAADKKRATEALDKIAHKWVKHLSAQDYMQIIGRARYLQNQVINLEKIRIDAEETDKAIIQQVKKSVVDTYENEIVRRNQEHRTAIKELSENYESEIHRLSKLHVNEIARLSEFHENEMAKLREHQENQIKRTTDKYKTENENLEKRQQITSISYENEISKLTERQQIISINYENEIQRLSNQYSDILMSTSWRLTKPLRFIRRSINQKCTQVVAEKAYDFALLIYRLPMFNKLIQRIPFTQKQRIRSFLTNYRPTVDIEQSRTKDKNTLNRVSIIIPVYNHAEYLKGCIDSAINQTWSNIEVLICDDASPDPGVKKVLQQYTNNPRCRIIFSEQNEGICETQNKLLDIAKGEIIAFLDCDDYLTPDAVEKCMQHWTKDTVYLHTGRINVDKNGNEINRISFELLPRKDYFEENLERMFATHFKLIHRDAFAKVGAFDSRFNSAQDYDMLMRIAFHYPTSAFVHVPQFLYSHRLHDKQATEVMNEKQLNSTDIIQAEARLRKSIKNGKFERFISIIMLSFGKKKQTLEALKSLRDTVKIPHEIILFDNGSEASTVDFIKSQIEGKFDNLKVFYNDANLGPAAGRQAALQHASGEWFIVFDNDEIAEPGWLEELLVRACSDETIGAVCCKVIFPNNILQFSGGFIRHEDDQLIELDLYDRGKNTYDLSTAVFRDCDWCPIGATLFTTNPAKLLHEGYPNVFEDAGVSMALKKQGKRLVNSPGSWVWHEHITFQKKSDVDMHDKYLSERYNPKRMLTSIKSFYNENGLLIHDEYIWRENNLYSLSRKELINLLETAPSKTTNADQATTEKASPHTSKQGI